MTSGKANLNKNSRTPSYDVQILTCGKAFFFFFLDAFLRPMSYYRKASKKKKIELPVVIIIWTCDYAVG